MTHTSHHSFLDFVHVDSVAGDSCPSFGGVLSWHPQEPLPSLLTMGMAKVSVLTL
jgi:hypothetical protein